MKLRFLHSKSRERERLLNIRNEYQWFINNNFPIILPEFYARIYQQFKNNKKLFANKLEMELDGIYHKNDYRPLLIKVKNNWQRIERPFFDILKNLDFKKKTGYFCFISLYGPQGQFQYPDIIDLRVLNNKDVKEANATIAHEIIHLLIYNQAKRLKLDYKKIEGAVDLFFKRTPLKKIFPGYKFQRGVTHNENLFKQLVKCEK